VQGKRDKLLGLKENVIVGRLIPAGTGGATSRVKKIAADRDQTVIEARRSEAEEAAALAAPLPVMEPEVDTGFDAGLVDTIESRDWALLGIGSALCVVVRDLAVRPLQGPGPLGSSWPLVRPSRSA
jgi:hypothetical protein